MNKGTVGREAAYVYIQFFISSISGYIFWLAITQLTTSYIVGTLSAIIAISEILTSFAMIGIPDSIQRVLGKSFYEKNVTKAKTYLVASLIFISIGIFTVGMLVIVDNNYLNSIEIYYNLKFVIILVVTSSAVNLLLISIIISSVKTKVLPTVNIISSVSKIVMAIFLAFSGSGVIGISLAYLFFGNVLSSALIGIYAIRLFRPMAGVSVMPTISLTRASKELLAGGLASWVPMLVTNLGIQLGTIVLFGSKGSEETALYFISLTIVNALLLGTISLTAIGLPILSSIQDGRKRFAWQTIRWGYLISIPLSLSIIFYSGEILNLLGGDYVEAKSSLQILLLSIAPIIIVHGVSNLVYSYGHYKKSLSIDFAMGIPRTVLYFILVPIYGSIGASLSFTIGALIGLIIATVVSRKIGMLLFWKELVLVIFIPITIGYILHIFQVNYIIGIPVIVMSSYICLLKLNILTNSDLHNVISILPLNISNQLLKLSNKFKRN